jgi:hypothetical protein
MRDGLADDDRGTYINGWRAFERALRHRSAAYPVASIQGAASTPIVLLSPPSEP